MRIHIIAIGQRMPIWVTQGYQEYARRMQRACPLVLKEIPAGRRTKSADIAQILRTEGERCLAALPSDCRTIALERLGTVQTTQGMALAMQAWLGSGQDVAFLIGGPEGLAPSCLARAHEQWSLSGLTLPHPLVRVLLAEQLYRAWSILNHLPYHRE